jgi:hypothetical protein
MKNITLHNPTPNQNYDVCFNRVKNKNSLPPSTSLPTYGLLQILLTSELISKIVRFNLQFWMKMMAIHCFHLDWTWWLPLCVYKLPNVII